MTSQNAAFITTGSPSIERGGLPSARVLTIFRTKDGVSPLVSGSVLLDALPLGVILVVLSLLSWLRRTHLQLVASITLVVTVCTEVDSELVLVLDDT